jgi:hypothetical protein
LNFCTKQFLQTQSGGVDGIGIGGISKSGGGGGDGDGDFKC